MNPKRLVKHFLLCISLANLTLLRVWSELLTSRPSDAYTMRHPARPADFIAAMISVCFLAVLFYAFSVVPLRTPRGRTLLRWSICLYMLLPLNAVRTIVANSYIPTFGAQLFRQTGRVPLVLIGTLCVGVFGVVLWAWRDRLPHIIATVLIGLSPLALLTFGQAAIGIARYNPEPFRDKSPAGFIPGANPARRVLWIIFDEMDERLTFVNRNPAIRLPELDRFRETSFAATNAFSPARVTLLSLPALIDGNPVRDARELGPADLLITHTSGTATHWQDELNIFSRARQSGFNTALAGWYHPYGRMLAGSLSECVWVERPTLYNSTGDTLRAILVNQLRSVMETSLLSPFGQSLATRHQVRSYETVLAAAKTFAADPRLGLVLLHLPVPHAPYIYNSRTGRCDRGNSPINGYNDALELADRSLGEIRKSMEAAHLWESTTVLVSSDHGYRGAVTVDGGASKDLWVPFLLKLPGANVHYQYDPRLDTVHSADLLLQALSGGITNSADAARWLDAQERGLPLRSQANRRR